jgi:multidrug efflux pump subunit AcrB
MSLGISGRLTQATIRSKLTPLMLLAALAAGLIALISIPREEEPQISVPMVDISVSADGLRAPDAAELVTKPLETIVKAINGVEHVYSQTQDDRVLVTARFRVGTRQDDAVLRVHDRIRANLDRIPPGIPEPLVQGRGIDDVAIVTLTLSPKPEAADRWTGAAVQHLAQKLQYELAKVEDVGLSYIVGSGLEEIRVEPDPEKLSLFGITLQQLVGKVREANRSFVAGQVRDGGGMRTLVSGHTLQGVPDIGLLVLTARDGRPVYVRDVAQVVVGPGRAETGVWSLARGDGGVVRTPAATLAIAKRAGANAVVVAQETAQKLMARRRSMLGVPSLTN